MQPLCSEDLQPGAQVGDYRIEKKLGEGGFGAVYRAVQPVIGKRVAVKVLNRELSEDESCVSRFIAEARATNTIGHKNIVDIFNFGTLDDGRRFFVMELLEGQSLDGLLAEHGCLDPPETCTIMGAVARALEAAHAKGIVHRDLKPENIFVSRDSEGELLPKLLDFGVAKLLGDAGRLANHQTRTGVPIGTPHYMSPEQILADEVDHRTDVYAFGVVCFECLTGTLVFDAPSYLDLLELHTRGRRPRVSERRPELGRAFDPAIETMMRIDKRERPASIGEAWALLEAACERWRESVLDGTFPADEPSNDATAQRPPAHHPPAQAATRGAAPVAAPPPTAVLSSPQPSTVLPARTVVVTPVAPTVIDAPALRRLPSPAPRPASRWLALTGALLGIAGAVAAGIIALERTMGESAAPSAAPPPPAASAESSAPSAGASSPAAAPTASASPPATDASASAAPVDRPTPAPPQPPRPAPPPPLRPPPPPPVPPPVAPPPRTGDDPLDYQ